METRHNMLISLLERSIHEIQCSCDSAVACAGSLLHFHFHAAAVRSSHFATPALDLKHMGVVFFN